MPTLTTPRKPAHVVPLANSAGMLARSRGVCAQVLKEAHRLSGLSIYTADFGRLLSRASELLDEIDELLLTLHPESNPSEFAMAAELHRTLEQIQASIPARFRGRPVTARDGPDQLRTPVRKYPKTRA
jgi:hypothetical protein